MRIEIRADGAHISGYVNATEKKSRPVITPHGRVVEEITPGAFRAAIGRGGEITLPVDHDQSHIYARTSDGTLLLSEDDIGLHAEVTITDFYPVSSDTRKNARLPKEPGIIILRYHEGSTARGQLTTG